MTNIFTEHPQKVGETYFEHMRNALRFSVTFSLLVVVSVIHSILPFLFTKTASCVVQAMAVHMKEREEKC